MNHDQYPLGPTGEFPAGRLNRDDEGGITLAIGSSKGKVLIDFGTPVAWFGLSPEDARNIAQMLIERACGIDGRPFVLTL